MTFSKVAMISLQVDLREIYRVIEERVKRLGGEREREINKAKKRG